MALDLTTQGLFAEVRKAKDHRDRFLGTTYWDSLERYVGPGYRREQSATTDFNNHSYKVLSTFLPLLASGNPRVKAKTPRQGSAAAITKAIEFGVNRNFTLQNMKKTVEQLATDWFFKWCVSLTMPRPTTGLLEREDPPYRPNTVRLSLMDFVWDPVALSTSEARFQAHKVIRDKDSILREAKEFPERRWNKSVVDAVTARPERERRGERLYDNYERDEIEFWEVWVPEAVLDRAYDTKGKKFKPTAKQGFNGTVYTVTRDGSEFLREPRPFWGPRAGPYTFSGYLYVPDRAVPLSMLAATYAQQEMHNMVWESVVAAARRYKRGIGVSSTAAAELAEKLAEFDDIGVFTIDAIDDVAKSIQQIELGGITQQHLTLLSTLGLNLEQQSGLTEALQGQVSGAGTATEASIAQNSAGKRLGYATEKFVTSQVRPIAEKEAWYLAMDPRAKIPLGEEADGVFIDPITGEPIEYPVLKGGMKNADLLEDLDIEIEPISMRYTSELLESERNAQQDAWLGTFGPMIPQLPWINWDQVLAKKAELWGDPSWAKVINLNKAMLVGQLQFQMNLAQVPQNGTAPQPRLSIDTGPKKVLKASESPAGFSRNARGQPNKGPRSAGTSPETHATPSKEIKQ